MDRELQHRMTYFVYCIKAFAYLNRFKGISFLDECYEAEHLLSIDDAVNDLFIICKRNGGALA